MIAEDNCEFCKISIKERLIENHYCFGRWDKYPVNKGHMLIIPYRHYDNYFNSSADELKALWDLVGEAKEMIQELYRPSAYNLGINIGKQAGQTIPHVHIHIIPRYK